ncbi:ADP-ribosylation factor family-domain-containing protein [Favolaschia claudopus]|uniref:ADP-ribosylation factor family-domain-containing protein n=1 Tax=Favolaschia claudopus TaxID=2862362 RepID=A0AAW0BGR1_9AGAR
MGSTISTLTGRTAHLLGLPKTFELVMLGLDDAGKTSFYFRVTRLHELPRGVLPTTISTMGWNIDNFVYGRHRITIWDFGGSRTIRTLSRSYLWNAHAFIFVLDAASPTRFAEAKQELMWLWQRTEKQHPVLVLANKIDLYGAEKLNVIEDALDIETMASSGRLIALKGVSAITGEGVDEALEWSVENISHELIAETEQAKKAVRARN